MRNMPLLRKVGQPSIGIELRRAGDSKSRFRQFSANGVRIRPAFAADFFGARNVGSIYGLMLTAWGFAGVLGPSLIARVRQSTGYPHRRARNPAPVMGARESSEPPLKLKGTRSARFCRVAVGEVEKSLG
jgi:hypothetical protein